MKNLLKPVVLVGGLLIVLLVAIAQSSAAPSVGQPTALPRPTASLPPGTGIRLSTPTAVSPMLKGKRPPKYVFPLAQTAVKGEVPEEYNFSEPQVVWAAGPEDATVSIVEWLPDNQHVLITQEHRGDVQQDIVVFNPVTGDKRVYAARRRIDKLPRWLPGLNVVIYSAMNIVGEDKTNHRIKFTRQMLISHGDPQNVRLIEDNLSDFSIGVNPDNSQVVYLAHEHLVKRSASLTILQAVPFDLSRWHYRSMKMGVTPSYAMAWRPGSSQVFLYSNGNEGGYTFLVDVNDGSLCELDFGGWAGVGRWSADGRYLAISRATESMPINSSDLAVLDTVTGKIYTPQIIPQEIIGRHYVEDFAWAPDNVHLVAIGTIKPFPPTGRLYDKDVFSSLYLVDLASGQSTRLLPKHKFLPGWPGTNLAWAPDGSNILIGCPANDILRLCLISVRRNKR